MHISHENRDHLTLASRCAWPLFKTNKIMNVFQLQGIANHPSVVGTYATFLVANLEIGTSDKLATE
eukprot:5334808-Ditylum_brightwellii.AAC.1